MKGQSDWLLYLFAAGLVVSMLIFIITSQVSFFPLSTSIEWSDGTVKVTFTGIAEIIITLAFAAGVLWRLIRGSRRIG